MSALRVFPALLVGATLVAHAQPQLPKGPNVIVGRVLDMTTDAPIGGAVVILNTQEAVREMERTGTRAVPRNVMTAPDGGFVFRDLAAGKYTITCSAFGYLRTDYPPLIVEVADGRPATITLRVWKHGSISGRVFDERGEPVVGLPVSALRRLAIGGALVLRESGTADTDDRGIYRLSNLTPGNYLVGVLASPVSLPASLADSVSATAPNSTARFQLLSGVHGGVRPADGDGWRLADFVLQQRGPGAVLSPDGRLLAYTNTLFPGTASAADATVVGLGSGEARGNVDFPLRFVPGVRVSGVATGPDGPLKHLVVRLMSSGAAEIDSFEPVGVTSAVTDDNGRFTFLSVPPGSYVLRSSWLVFGSPNQNTTSIALASSQALNVGEADVTGLTVALKPPARVIGRVEFKPAPGTPDAAYERVTVILRPVAATSWNALPGDVQPDRTFEASAQFPGRQELYAASAGAWRVVNVTSGGQPQPDYMIDLGDRDLTDVVVTMSNAVRRVSGTVADVKGALQTGADVIVFPADTTVWREGIFQSRRVQRVRTSSTGSFDMNFLAPGDYYLTAVDARLTLDWEDPLFLERLIPGATKITLADGDNKTVALVTFTPKR